MPWCEDCARYFTPSAMNDDGTCPSCGRTVQPTTPERITAKNLDLHKLAAGDHGDPDETKAPWHFRVLMVLLVLYLGWRIVDLFV